MEYLEMLESFGAGATPRQCSEQTAILSMQGKRKHYASIKAASMALHRMEIARPPLAFSVPEGKTRRYFITPAGRRRLRYERICALEHIFLIHKIQANKDRTSQAKQMQEEITGLAERNFPRLGNFCSFLTSLVTQIVDSVYEIMDAIRFPLGEETVRKTVSASSSILNSVGRMQNEICMAMIIAMLLEWRNAWISK